jgi:tRNA A37 threonylcarbamoyladenosine dehydratase
MLDWLERTVLLIGENGVQKLKNTNVLLVGLGGIGSYAGEFLVRAGVGSITIVDGDDVDITNINRQLQALSSTVGKNKAQLISERFLDINPDLIIKVITKFLEPKDIEIILDENRYDFILDCIDSVLPKVTLLSIAVRKKLKIISSMGAGGKLDPSKVKVADLFKTKECKFAQQVRKEMKRRNITKGIIAVYSEEIQLKDALKYTDGTKYKKSFYGTISYMPALFGLRMSAEVIRRVIQQKDF